jgi:hypothetical protein
MIELITMNWKELGKKRSWYLMEGMRKITGNLAEIRTEHLQNTSLEQYH